jgi:hypothetical protein
MTKHAPSAKTTANGSTRKTSKAAKGGKTVTTKLGNVSVTGRSPSAEMIKANVDRSTAALVRVADRLIKGGVTLPRKKGIPYYSLDRDNPKIVIRKLDGVITRGEFADGKFKEFS